MRVTAALVAQGAVLVGYLLLAASLAFPWLAVLSYRLTPLETPVGWAALAVVLLLALHAVLADRLRLPRVLWVLPVVIGSFLLGASLVVVGSHAVLNEVASTMLEAPQARALEMLDALGPAARLVGLDVARYRTLLEDLPGRFEATVLLGLWLFVGGAIVVALAACWRLGVELGRPARTPTADVAPAVVPAGPTA